MSESRYGGKTVMARTAIHCPTEADFIEFKRLRTEDGMNSPKGPHGNAVCWFLYSGKSITHSSLDYAKQHAKVITLAEFKLRIGADGKSPKKPKDTEVKENHTFITDGVLYDVIVDAIDGLTIAALIAQRDDLTAKLRRFRDFKRRVAK